MHRWGSTRSAGEQLLGPHPLGVDDDHLAGLDLAHEGGPHDVEGRGLRRRAPSPRGPRRGRGVRGTAAATRGRRAHPRRGWRRRATKEKAPSSTGSTCAALSRAVSERRALTDPAASRRPLSAPAASHGERPGTERQELGHEVAVGGDHPGQHAGLLGQGGRVGQVAVVAQSEARPARRSGRRVGRCATPTRRWSSSGCGRWRDAPGRQAMVRSSKTVVTRPMSLHHGDGLAVAHRHAGRLLAAVLQRVACRRR